MSCCTVALVAANNTSLDLCSQQLMRQKYFGIEESSKDVATVLDIYRAYLHLGLSIKSVLLHAL